jgi:putative MFS transporter
VLGTLAGILVFQAIVFLVFGFETKGRALEDVAGTDVRRGMVSNASGPVARLRA